MIHDVHKHMYNLSNVIFATCVFFSDYGVLFAMTSTNPKYSHFEGQNRRWKSRTLSYYHRLPVSRNSYAPPVVPPARGVNIYYSCRKLELLIYIVVYVYSKFDIWT